MPDADLIGELFADADTLRDDAETLKDKREANRDALRTMERAGKLTDEQVAKLHMYYPPRKSRTTEEG